MFYSKLKKGHNKTAWKKNAEIGKMGMIHEPGSFKNKRFQLIVNSQTVMKALMIPT